MKQLTITITALVTDNLIEEEINPIIKESIHTEKGISGHGALRIVDAVDYNYAEIISARIEITDAQIGEKK